MSGFLDYASYVCQKVFQSQKWKVALEIKIDLFEIWEEYYCVKL